MGGDGLIHSLSVLQICNVSAVLTLLASTRQAVILLFGLSEVWSLSSQEAMLDSFRYS